MWESSSVAFKNKIYEIAGVFQSFFLFKVADRIGESFLASQNNNELLIISLLATSIFLLVFIWRHLKDNLDLAEDKIDSKKASLIGVFHAPLVIGLMILNAFILWLSQMFSVVLGNYVTLFAYNYTAFNAIPITLAIGSFFYLAKFSLQ